MSYDLQLQNVDEDGEEMRDEHQCLVITRDDEKTYYYDGGEPEDSSFNRDYSWIMSELQQAYDTGVKDGRVSYHEMGQA